MHTRETGVPGDSISGRRRYISSPGTFFVADTSSRGNASFLRSSESQEFDVVILLSWSRDPSRGCGRTGVARMLVARLTSTSHAVAGAHPRFSYFTKKAFSPTYQMYFYLAPTTLLDDFSDFRVSRGVESTLALEFCRDFLAAVIRFLFSILFYF